MTLLDIETSIATYFELANGTADLIVNQQDIALVALNQVRRQAELLHDFEFSRKLVTVSVNGVTGGSLEDAVLYSDGTTEVDIKSVIECGLFDDEGNLCPVEWTTVSESLERQRMENRWEAPRYLTDDWYTSGPKGGARFVFTGSDVFRFPKDTTTTFTLGLEVYSMQSEWTAMTGTPADIWTTYGAQYLLWGAIVQLNHLFKHFVFRQEGNLPPPEKLRDEGLQAFIAWDSFRYEQNRRHSR